MAGDRTAVIDPTRRLTYRGLHDRVGRLAHWLRLAGVGTGDRVAIVLANGSPYLETVFAAARIGAMALPINTRLSPSELAGLLDDSTPVVLFHAARFRDTVLQSCALAARPPATLIEVGGDPDRYESEIMNTAPTTAVAEVRGEDPALLMYTSGSSGHPKGALLPHRKTLFNSLNAQLYFGLTARDRILVCTPLFHSLGLNILSLPALYAGATLVLHDGFDPDEVWTTLAREDITYMGGVPTQYQRLHDVLTVKSPPKPALLRFCFTAGAAIPVELVHAYAEHELVLKQGYGQTETSILTCLDEKDAVRKAGSVGQPVFHGDVRVVPSSQIDVAPDAWQPTEPGAVGEIVVRGPITMLGYWNQPEATKEVMRGDWLRTTDLASRDEEGFLTLTGRLRDMFISGGENVYPAELEALFLEHPAIREIAIVGVPDPEWGEVGRAHVVMQEGQTLNVDTLSDWARKRLAAFKVPRRFLPETELPRTASGKIKKYLLQRSPDPREPRD